MKEKGIIRIVAAVLHVVAKIIDAVKNRKRKEATNDKTAKRTEE